MCAKFNDLPPVGINRLVEAVYDAGQRDALKIMERHAAQEGVRIRERARRRVDEIMEQVGAPPWKFIEQWQKENGSSGMWWGNALLAAYNKDPSFGAAPAAATPSRRRRKELSA